MDRQASKLAVGETSLISECSLGDQSLCKTLYQGNVQQPYRDNLFPESERLTGIHPASGIEIQHTPQATAAFCDLKGTTDLYQQLYSSARETAHTHPRTARLSLELYGKHVERDRKDVELILYIGDKECLGWSRISCDEKALKSKTLKRMPDSTNLKVLVKLQLDEDHEACWMLGKLNGEPVYPATQVIDVTECPPFCRDGELEQAEWMLHNVQGTAPAFFRCFIDIGYTQDQDPSRARFSPNLPKARVHAVLNTGTSVDLTRSVSAPALHQGHVPNYSFEFRTPTQDTHQETSSENNTTGIQCEDELPITTGDDANLIDLHILNPDQIKVVPVASDSEMRTRFQHMVHGFTEKEVYRMQQRPRGVFLIINNEAFGRSKRELEGRVGTHNDVKALFILFTELGFQVEIKNECSSQEMESAISEVLMRNHSEYDCFACAILSHGGEGVITGDDGTYLQIETVRKLVSENKNKSLIDKPKLLFIQACQGGSMDCGNEVETVCGRGARLKLEKSFSDVGDTEHPSGNDADVVQNPTGESSCTSGNTETPAGEGGTVEKLSGEGVCGGSSQQSGKPTAGRQETKEGTQKAKGGPYSVDGPKIPSGSDLFMGISSCPGFAAYRSTQGTPYIQAIVKVFSEHAYHDHLSDLMTKVSSQVSAMEANDERYKQQPTFRTTSRKKLYFFPGLFRSRTN